MPRFAKILSSIIGVVVFFMLSVLAPRLSPVTKWLLTFVIGGTVFVIVFLAFSSLQYYGETRRRLAVWKQWKHGAFGEQLPPFVYEFFIADRIDPVSFAANFHALSRFDTLMHVLNPAFDLAGEFPPTRSVATFEGGLNAPTEYPRWFIAAYPDVVLWLATMVEDSPMDVYELLREVYDSERVAALIQAHGNEEGASRVLGEMVDTEGFLRREYLRKIVTAYQKHTGNEPPLECSIVRAIEGSHIAPRGSGKEPDIEPDTQCCELLQPSVKKVLEDAPDESPHGVEANKPAATLPHTPQPPGGETKRAATGSIPCTAHGRLCECGHRRASHFKSGDCFVQDCSCGMFTSA